MTIDELFEFIAKKARKTFNEDHHHYPMFFVDFKERTEFGGKEVDFAIVPMEWDTEEDRETISIMMRALCGMGKVRHIAFLHEVWMVRTTDAEGGRVAPSEHPDRVSVLWLSIDSCDFENRTGYWPVIDADTKRARLGEFTECPMDAETASGRFANMFGKPPVKQ